MIYTNLLPVAMLALAVNAMVPSSVLVRTSVLIPASVLVPTSVLVAVKQLPTSDAAYTSSVSSVFVSEVPASTVSAQSASTVSVSVSVSVSTAHAIESHIFADVLAGIQEGLDHMHAYAAGITSSMSVQAAKAEATQEALASSANTVSIATSIEAARQRPKTSVRKVRWAGSAAESEAAVRHREKLDDARRIVQAPQTAQGHIILPTAVVSPAQVSVVVAGNITAVAKFTAAAPSTANAARTQSLSTVTVSLLDTACASATETASIVSVSVTITVKVAETATASCTTEESTTTSSPRHISCSLIHNRCPSGMFCASKANLRGRGFCVPLPATASVCAGKKNQMCEGENVCVSDPRNSCSKQMGFSRTCEGMCVRIDGLAAGGIA